MTKYHMTTIANDSYTNDEDIKTEVFIVELSSDEECFLASVTIHDNDSIHITVGPNTYIYDEDYGNYYWVRELVEYCQPSLIKSVKHL